MIGLGLTRTAISRWVAAGRLHRIHRGIYAIVAAKLLRREGHWKAATLAVGDGAVLSHRSAASHWGLLSYGGSRIDVTVPRKLRPRPGITLHCPRSLPERDMSTKDAIPCTTVARTLADIAASEPPRLFERAVGQAEVTRVFDRGPLEEILTAEPRRPGSRAVRELLARRSNPASLLTRSGPEEALLSLCREGGIATPELNVPFTLPDGTPIVIDALWRKQRLALEVDSEAYHSPWEKQVADRRRDAQLTLAGLRPVRLTEEDLTAAARATTSLLRSLVGGR